MKHLLAAAADDRKALSELKRLGFADPRAALANLHALTPDPVDAELLDPLLPRLLKEMSEAPDPDMALNNLERLAAQGERAALFRPLERSLYRRGGAILAMPVLLWHLWRFVAPGLYQHEKRLAVQPRPFRT